MRTLYALAVAASIVVIQNSSVCAQGKQVTPGSLLASQQAKAEQCLAQYNFLSDQLRKCFSDWGYDVEELAKRKAFERAEELCVQLHPDQFPNGIPKRPPLHPSYPETKAETDAFNEYLKQRSALEKCAYENLAAPTPADYSKSQGEAYFGECSLIQRAASDPMAMSAVLQANAGTLPPNFGRPVPQKECTSLIGKNAACDLHQKLVALCTPPWCDVGRFEVTRECEPNSKFQVKSSSSPPKGRQVNQDIGASGNSSKSKNNLDRFGLGPTYVDTSSAGVPGTSRGATSAKSAAGTGTKSGMKATVQQDVGSQPSGGSTSRQKTIVVPAQKEFLGKPIIEPK